MERAADEATDAAARAEMPADAGVASVADTGEDRAAEDGHELHLPDDRFIPVRSEDLGEALGNDRATFGPDAPLLAAVARELEEIIEQEASAMERTLSRLYVPFNPDRDTIPYAGSAKVEAPLHVYTEIQRWMAYLLEKANFERLDEVNLEAVVRQAGNSSMKIRIRPERIEHLDLWVRGKSTATRRWRTWRSPIKGVEREVGVYRRLAVVGRLRGDGAVFIKMFREIPFHDIEALLPHAEIQMSMFDRIKVWGGGAGALGGAAGKILQVGLFATSISKLAWILIVPLGGLAVKSFFGYRTAKIHRESQRTKHLYYQNLASNAAAIHMLTSLIAQEEVKEALLAYAICLRRTTLKQDVEDEAAIGGECEAYLRDRFGVEVDFDVSDAIETLDRLGLRHGPTGSRCLVPIRDAIALLTDHWRRRRSECYHEAMVRTKGQAKSLKGTRWG